VFGIGCFVIPSFLAVCLVRFLGRLSVWFFSVRFQPVGFGLLPVTIKLSELVFVLGWLACGTAFRFLWLAGWIFWLMASGFGGFGLVSVGCCRAGGVGGSALCGSAVLQAFRVWAKRHPHAQQASQRDCPPFRLVKSVFFTGKRLRC
jgi:hypothetical protein